MRSLTRFALSAAAACVIGVLAYAQDPASQTGTWTAAGSMAAIRSDAQSVRLFDGRVLVTGGSSSNGPLRSAELFATSEGFTAAGSMIVPRARHAAVALFDGRVLVTGGFTSDGSAVNSAEIYDPWTNQWHTLPASMSEARAGHTATLLDDGRVMIAGGDDGTVASSSVEVFDPSMEAFGPAGVLSAPRTHHAATLLHDGRVLIAGGTDRTIALASVDIVDADSGWAAQAVMAEGRAGLSATTLADGKVLLAGGSAPDHDLASTEIYDPASGTLSTGASLAKARSNHFAFLLPDNNAVLIAGGTLAGVPLGSSELYYPWSNQVYGTGPLSIARTSASGVPLDVNGQLFVAGGAESATAETYHFATLRTDRDDYAPGQTVTISGSGWQPGETIRLFLEESPAIDQHEPLTALVDAAGNFVNTDWAPDEHDLNVRFNLTAVGMSSQAQRTFTDASNASSGDGSMTVSPATANSGSSSNDFTFSFVGDKNGSFNAGSQVQVTIPSGWTSPQAANSNAPGFVSVTNNGCSSVAIAGTTATSVTININCPKDSGFSLAYKKVQAPSVGVTTPYTFRTQTRQAAGSFVDIALQPVITVTVSCTGPSVTANPANGTVTYGQNATFTAQASGNPAPTVQWQVSAGAGFTNIAGATSTTLTLTTPPVSATGNQYRAVFTNSCAGTQTASSTAATLTVNKASLTVTADNQSRVYGAANPTFTATITGFVNSETLATSGVTGSPALSTTADASSAVGSYAIAPAQGTLAAVNYTFVFVNGTLTVTRAQLTATADDQSKEYGAAIPPLTVSFSGFVNGDTATALTGNPTVTTSATATSAVGAFPITITAGTLVATNYDVTFVNGKLTVTKAPVTVTADAKSKTYGEGDPSLTYSLTSGHLVGSDSFSGELGRVSGETVGSYAIQQNTLTLNSNYTLTYIGANLAITSRAVTVAADAKSKTYGEADPSLTYHVASGSLVSGDSFTGALDRVAGENVGSYAIQQNTLALSANYALIFVGANLTISPRAVTVTADAMSKTYGDEDPTLTYQITTGTLVSGDTLSGALGRVAGESVGEYAIQQNTLALNANYTLTFVSSNLTIGARPVTVTADAQKKPYGDADPPLTYQITGETVFDDVFSGALHRESGEAVGVYAIQQGTLRLNTNYNLTFVSANLTIDRRAVTVTADAKNKTYGDGEPDLTYQISSGSLVSGDTFTGGLNREPGEHVGSYGIHQNTLTLGSNYTLSYVGANLTIEPRAVTVTADAQTKTYGDADPTLTYQMSSGTLVPGDSFSGALGRVAGENVGTYVIQKNTLALNANYALSYIDASLTITPATLSVTADNSTKVYGQPNPSFTAHIDGLVNGDSATSLTGSLAFMTTAGTLSPVGQYEVMPGGLTSHNYAVSFVPGTLTITKATPTVVVSGGPFTYDGEPHAAGAVANGVGGASVSGAFTFVYDGNSAAPTNAGIYTALASFASSDANYLNATGSATLTINKANQTITLTGIPSAVTLGQGPFTISAAATSGLPVVVITSGACTLAGNILAVTGPGLCSVTANQSGSANYNPAAPAVNSFTTTVAWSNVLPPINVDGSSTFKYNSTIPVKFKLTGSSAGIQNLTATIMIVKYSEQAIGAEIIAASTSAADFGNTFRYDPSAGQYIFNLSTKLSGMSQGTWQIVINLGDGIAHRVFVSVRN